MLRLQGRSFSSSGIRRQIVNPAETPICTTRLRSVRYLYYDYNSKTLSKQQPPCKKQSG
ncbi:hypothetical protein [Ruminococcus sp. YE282]|uniref:hypothetical protein n=1 Tax=Ruminococcus sp. YE282 TaxID=3158780 RepID=UPI00088931F0|nr:hypothetical protein [Ruminococcus bromii]SCY33688.1 hypothetical protein SAMN02910441_01266 [Ruminococcus bromii]